MAVDVSLYACTRPVVLFPLFLVALYCLHCKLTNRRAVPSSLPWAGVRNEWCPKIRANLRDMQKGRENLEEGYQKVGLMP